MREPLAVQSARASLAIADAQEELAQVWDDTIGKWLGLDSKLRQWAAARRESARRTLHEWPVSAGGTVPDDVWHSWKSGDPWPPVGDNSSRS